MSTNSVVWWGHAMSGIEIDGVRVLTDPVLRPRIGPLRWHGPRPPAGLAGATDLVVISHLHRDHLDLPSLARFGPSTTIITPRGAARMVKRVARGEVVELDVGESIRTGPISVVAVPATHPSWRDPLRPTPRAKPQGYVISGSHRVYFAGDTELFEGMAAIRQDDDIDLALLPVGGWGLTLGAGHMDPAQAVEALGLIRPRLAVPIHCVTLRPPLLWRARRRLFEDPRRAFAAYARGRTDVVVADTVSGQRVLLDRGK